MSLPTTQKSALLFASILVLALPIISFAQGRGNGKGNGVSDVDRKCSKFVNCHDARDGRWDGRGPAANTTFTRFPASTNRDAFRHRRYRDRERDNENFDFGSRKRRSDWERHRNFSSSDTWRHRRVADGTENRHRH